MHSWQGNSSNTCMSNFGVHVVSEWARYSGCIVTEFLVVALIREATLGPNKVSGLLSAACSVTGMERQLREGGREGGLEKEGGGRERGREGGLEKEGGGREG